MDDEVKVAILEQKQEVLEQFVGKLDSAIEKIAEVNTNVSKMPVSYTHLTLPTKA